MENIKEFYPKRNREKGLIGNVWSKKVFFGFWFFLFLGGFLAVLIFFFFKLEIL